MSSVSVPIPRVVSSNLFWTFFPVHFVFSFHFLSHRSIQTQAFSIQDNCNTFLNFSMCTSRSCTQKKTMFFVVIFLATSVCQILWLNFLKSSNNTRKPMTMSTFRLRFTTKSISSFTSLYYFNENFFRWFRTILFSFSFFNFKQYCATVAVSMRKKMFSFARRSKTNVMTTNVRKIINISSNVNKINLFAWNSEI